MLIQSTNPVVNVFLKTLVSTLENFLYDRTAGLPGACNWKAKLRFKKGQILDFTK